MSHQSKAGEYRLIRSVLKAALLVTVITLGCGWRDGEKTAEDSDPELVLPNVPMKDLRDLDEQPVPTHQVAPEYPLELRAAGVTGRVVVGFIVNSRGRVSHAEAILSDHELFSLAAVAAVRAWTFKPGKVEGRAVNTRMQVPIVFNITDEEVSAGSAATREETEKVAAPPPRPVWDVAPKPIKQTDPEYPWAMRRIGDDGRVRVRFQLTESGRVENPYIVESTNPAFDEPAVDAVMDWRFSPAEKDGKPIAADMQVSIVFSIKGREARQRWQVDTPKAWPDSMPEAFRWDEPPVLHHYAVPVYPRTALLEDRRGKVQVKFALDENGRVITAQPAGEGDDDLMAAAIAAVQTFRFWPARRDGRPCGAMLNMTFNFSRSHQSDVPFSGEDKRILKMIRRGVANSPLALLDELDAVPRALSQRPPLMPPELRLQGREGKALIQFVIDRKGFARLPMTVKASDPACGAAAVQAVNSWRFEVPRRAGKPVDVLVLLPVEFHLED